MSQPNIYKGRHGPVIHKPPYIPLSGKYKEEVREQLVNPFLIKEMLFCCSLRVS